MRKATICEMDIASPQSSEASVKPSTEARNTRLRPNRPVIHPVSGIAIAEATI